MNHEEIYMRKCISLAEKGKGNTSPNPMVGCIIVYNKQIIGEGYHEKFGEPHAEINAIESVKDKSLLQNSELYVTLEPCSHQGKTPPCTDSIIKYGIKKIYIGCKDPSDKVNGMGIAKLTNAGCDIKVGILEKESSFLNRRFFTYHLKKRPYIIIKWAQTKDGYIDHSRKAGTGSAPLQISNIESQILSHTWRSEEDAIMIGTNTALLDNPLLTTRLVKGKNPLRVIIDRKLKIPFDFNLYNTDSKTIIFTEKEEKNTPQLSFIKIDFNAHILEQILSILHKNNVNSIIIEGGTKLLASFIECNLWDEARVFNAPFAINNGVKAPVIQMPSSTSETIGNNLLNYYYNPQK